MTRAGRIVALVGEAVRDALRSRVGLFALLGAVFVGFVAERCTGGGPGLVVVDGEVLDLSQGARLLGPVIYGVSALALVLISAFVACDTLARPLADGSALLWLARPIARRDYALARLAGALLLSVGAAAAVLAVVGFLLHARLGLPLGPAGMGILACVLDAWVVSAVAMTLALWLPRVVALGFVTIWTQVLAFSNGLHLVADTGGGTLAAVERWGPPLGTALLYALAPWYASAPGFDEWSAVWGRLVAWGVGATLALVWAFRSHELG